MNKILKSIFAFFGHQKPDPEPNLWLNRVNPCGGLEEPLRTTTPPEVDSFACTCCAQTEPSTCVYCDCGKSSISGEALESVKRGLDQSNKGQTHEWSPKFGTERRVKACRKDYTCARCGVAIPKGTECLYVYVGKKGDFRLCPTCANTR